MANNLLVIFLVLFACSVFSQEEQQTLYVSVNDGSDSSTCDSTTNPCASLSGAISKINTTMIMIYFAPGEYTGANNIGVTFPSNTSYAFIGEDEGVLFNCQNDENLNECFTFPKEIGIEKIDISNCFGGIHLTGDSVHFTATELGLSNVNGYGIQIDDPIQFNLHSSKLSAVPNGVIIGSPAAPAHKFMIDQSVFEDSNCIVNSNIVSVANTLFTKSSVDVNGANAMDESNIIFDTCIFSSTVGSALSITNGHVVVKNSTFNNCVGNNGGAIFAGGALSFTLFDVTFDNNNATNGGAIDLVSSSYSANLTNTVFSGNIASVGSVLACCQGQNSSECSIQVAFNNVIFEDGNSKDDVACPISILTTPTPTPSPSPSSSASTPNSTNWGLIIGSIVLVLIFLVCVGLVIAGGIFFYKKRKANYDQIF